MGDRWGSAGPPPEAYSRVSNPDRFAGLHTVARELVLELEHRYAVVRTDTTEPDDRDPISTDPGVVDVVTLTPDDPAAAPLTVVLTSFPGLLVQAGHTSRAAFPICGCDACDETLDDATTAFTDHVTGIVDYGFAERIVRDRGWWHELTTRTATDGGTGRVRLARALLTGMRSLLPDAGTTWQPWTPSAPAAATDLDLRDLPEVQRRVVDHVVTAIFQPGELTSATVIVDRHQVAEPTDHQAPGLVVVFTAHDGDRLEQPLTVTRPRWANANHLSDDLAAGVEDWISETTYAWGQQRPRPQRPAPGPR